MQGDKVMNLNQLYYFIKTVDKKSMTNASKELFLSQQALSSAISNLERELDTCLLIRNHKGVVATPEGEIVYEKASHILNLCDQLIITYKHKDVLATWEEINIAINRFAKSTFLKNTISYFYRFFPNLEINYLNSTNENIFSLLDKGKCDFGISVFPAIDNKILFDFPDSLNFFVLKEYSVEALVAQHSALAKQSKISIKDLLDHPIMINTYENKEINPFYLLLDRYCETNDIIDVDSFELIFQFVKDGIGNMLTVRELQPDYTSVANIPLKENISLQVCCIINKKQKLNLSSELFIKVLQESI